MYILMHFVNAGGYFQHMFGFEKDQLKDDKQIYISIDWLT